MRLFTLAAGAALILLAASPALAGGPRGGGGGHPPRPGPCCGHPGGGNTNINVNVNAAARASAFADARSHLNARAYDVGGIRRGYSGGGVVYVGGGYGGDVGGVYMGGPVYYNEAPYEGVVCTGAPFGYVINGFGRDERRRPRCGYGYGYADDRYDDRDRGGRYGYSERHDSYAESRYESYEEYGAYEAYETGYVDAAPYEARYAARYEEPHEARYEAPHGVSNYDRGYLDGQRDCDCRREEPVYYEPAYAPEPPRYDPYDSPTARPYYPLPDPAPRQRYSQEPGERG